MATFLQYEEYFTKYKDPVVDTWPLMDSLVSVVCIVAVYVFTVVILGPWFMATRKPYNLRTALVAYNFLVLVNTVFLATWPILGQHLKTLFQDGCHYKEGFPKKVLDSMNSFSWYFLLSKVIELADTIFIVLRKKDSQVTKLHVYHHATAPFYMWFYMKYVPGPQAIVSCLLNLTVHIFMYTYYMLAAMGPKYQKYVWWKKYMTIIQLVQFLLGTIYNTSLLVYSCNLPPATSLYFLAISSSYLYLFANFYYSTYNKKEKST